MAHDDDMAPGYSMVPAIGCNEADRRATTEGPSSKPDAKQHESCTTSGRSSPNQALHGDGHQSRSEVLYIAPTPALRGTTPKLRPIGAVGHTF